jgi:hypothetical protein
MVFAAAWKKTLNQWQTTNADRYGAKLTRRQLGQQARFEAVGLLLRALFCPSQPSSSYFAAQPVFSKHSLIFKDKIQVHKVADCLRADACAMFGKAKSPHLHGKGSEALFAMDSHIVNSLQSDDIVSGFLPLATLLLTPHVLLTQCVNSLLAFYVCGTPLDVDLCSVIVVVDSNKMSFSDALLDLQKRHGDAEEPPTPGSSPNSSDRGKESDDEDGKRGDPSDTGSDSGSESEESDGELANKKKEKEKEKRKKKEEGEKKKKQKESDQLEKEKIKQQKAIEKKLALSEAFLSVMLKQQACAERSFMRALMQLPAVRRARALLKDDGRFVLLHDIRSVFSRTDNKRSKELSKLSPKEADYGSFEWFGEPSSAAAVGVNDDDALERASSPPTDRTKGK